MPRHAAAFATPWIEGLLYPPRCSTRRSSSTTLPAASRISKSIGPRLAAVELKLESARAAIEAYHGLPIDEREGPSFLRYGPGGFYRRHCDQAAEAAWPDAARRQVSLVIFLNSSRSVPEPNEFSGGELVMFPEDVPDVPTGEPIEIVPQQGSLIAFRAATAHEVRPVSAGVRDVIVDWFY